MQRRKRFELFAHQFNEVALTVLAERGELNAVDLQRLIGSRLRSARLPRKSIAMSEIFGRLKSLQDAGCVSCMEQANTSDPERVRFQVTDSGRRRLMALTATQ